MNNNYSSVPQNAGNNPLTKRVCRANEIVNELFAINEEKSRLQNLAAAETRSESTYKNKLLLVALFPLCLIVLPMALFLPSLFIGAIIVSPFEKVVSVEIVDAISFIIVGAILIIVPPIVLVVALLVRKHLAKKHHNALIKYREQIKEKENAVNTLIDCRSGELDIIPAQYRYPLATNYISELFINGRANSIPEALDKYEEQLHRWKMEQSAQENIAIQLAQTEVLHQIWKWI